MNESNHVPEGAPPPAPITTGWRSPRRRVDVDRIEGGHTPLKVHTAPVVPLPAATPWGLGEQRHQPTAPPAWVRYRWSDLVDVDRDQLVAIAERVALDPGHLVDSLHVARNRFGHAVVFGVADVGGDGLPAEVFGQPVIRWHVVPVPTPDLPAAVGGAWTAADR